MSEQERKPSIRTVAEQRHEAQCAQSHGWGEWQVSCVRAVDREVARIAGNETWWHRS